MKKLSTKKFIIQILLFLVISSSIWGAEFPYKLTIKNITGEIEDHKKKEFDAYLIDNFNKKNQYFRLISTSLNKEIKEATLDRLSDFTEEDLTNFGHLQIYDYLLEINLIEERSGFSSSYKAIVKIFNINTRGINAITETDQDLHKLAQKIVQKIYNKWCVSRVIIRSNVKEVICKFNSTKKVTSGKYLNLYLPKDEYKMEFTKDNYRTFDTSFVLKEQPVNINLSLRKTGSYIKLTGSPPGAKINIENDHIKKFGQIPYETFLNQGKYKVFLSYPGYESISASLNIPDQDEKIIRSFQLPVKSREIAESVIMPGWGQWKMGYKWQGFGLTSLFLGSLGGAGYSYYKYDIFNDQVTDLKNELANSQGKSSEYFANLHDKIDNKQQYRDLFFYSTCSLAGIGAITYLYNLVDIVFLKSHRKQSQKPFKPDDSVFDEISFKVNHAKEMKVTWSYSF